MRHKQSRSSYDSRLVVISNKLDFIYVEHINKFSYFSTSIEDDLDEFSEEDAETDDGDGNIEILENYLTNYLS